MTERGVNLVWLVLVAGLSSWACVASTQELGVTFDEPTYIERGLQRWREGTLSPLIRLGTMPLPVDVQTAPLYWWERLNGPSFDPRADLERLLPAARAMNLLFWWLLLSYAFLFAQHLAGSWAGRLTVLLLACEPSLLAHAALATTDLSVTATLVALAYHYWTGREASWGRRVGLPALWFGLAALCKASGPVFGVLLLLALEGYWRVTRPASTTSQPSFLRDVVQIVGLGTLLLFAYCRSDWQPQADALRWAEKLPEGRSRDLAVAAISALRVFPNAADGFFRQVGHNARGHGAYLLGVTSPSALWWYFPVLLSIKLSLPVLMLLLGLAVTAPRSLLNPALVCVGVLFAFSVFCRVQIGVRFMFPLICLLLIGLSVAVVRWAQPPSLGRPPRLAAVGLGLSCASWAVLVALSAWPNGLSFVNEFYARSQPAYRWVSESNFDWGHGVPLLKKWATAHAGEKLPVWYYGADPALGSEPFELVRLHEGDIDANLQRLRGRYLAVSATLVYGPPLSPLVVETRKRLHSREPIVCIGTFLIYEMSP
ncbi:MAG: hypothetical protein SNJ82_08870 [Gemmataceae bacterium]